MLQKLQAKTKNLPPIGQRILKSAFAVFVVYIIYYLRDYKGIPFYSAISAIQCIQPYKANSKKVMLNRVFGTFNGAFFGLITILIDMYYIQQANQLLYFLLVSFMIIPLMYTSIACKKAEVTYFCCVVYLSITITHIGDESPLLFVLNRIIDTFIGIAVASLINNVRRPKVRDKKTLFVTGLDETILTPDRRLTPYSLVELNRMIENGMQFTISTERTLASLIEANRGINLQLPVILFNGAVLYDLKKNKLLAIQTLDHHVVAGVKEIIHKENVCCFTSSFVQETLIIYYDKLFTEQEAALYEKLRVSPYRNYHQGDFLEDTQAFYMMAYGEDEKISDLYHKIKASPYRANLRMVRMKSLDYPGYVYLKMYDSRCTKKEMLEELQRQLKIEKVVTVGTIPSQYDVVLPDENENQTVKQLKKLFETTPHM